MSGMDRLLFAIALVGLVGCRPILGIEETALDPATCTLVTQRVFFADKPAKDLQLKLGAPTEARLRELAEGIGITLDGTRGHAVAEVRDCDDEPAAARLRTIPADGTAFSTHGEGLQLEDTSGVEGLTGVFNLAAPEEYELTAFPDEIAVESSQSDVVVRAGELSRVTLAPNSEVVVTPPSEDEWRCVGTIAEPQPSDDAITFTIELRRATVLLPNGGPIGGARIIVCRDEAAACEAEAPVPPGDEAFTDASGRALLQVSTQDGPFDGHLVISGRDPSCGD